MGGQYSQVSTGEGGTCLKRAGVATLWSNISVRFMHVGSEHFIPEAFLGKVLFSRDRDVLKTFCHNLTFYSFFFFFLSLLFSVFSRS